MSFPISSVTSNQTSTDSSNLPVPSAQMLSQQDFLNLLVAQMTAQDPLKPTDSQDLLSQMTQFSTLNANNSMQTQLSNLGLSQQFSDANSILGKQVTLQLDSKTTAQGIVTGIDTSANVPQIIVNGHSYTLDKVISITNPTATTQ
jgi:flagellar basal-body rod modification protein FlgD